MRFDKNLSAIHSYLCADGYVIKNPENQKHKYYHIGLRNTCPELLKDFQKRFEIVFGLKPIITPDGRCRIQNKEVYQELTKNFSYYSRGWTLPKLSKENSRCWLRSFFDCEGWVVVRKSRDRHVGADSVNHKGLRDISSSLKAFGIISSIKLLRKRDMSRLFIYGKENLLRFKKEINFLHPSKKTKLQEAMDSYVSYEWEFPANKKKLRECIFQIMKKKAKIKRNSILRVDSIKKENLLKLAGSLQNFFGVEAKVYGPWRNNSTQYYELCINKKQDSEKVRKLFGI